MLTRVTLHGALAEVAGDAVWTLDIHTPGEALRAIEVQICGVLGKVGGLFAHLIAKDEEGVTYRVIADGEDVAGSRETLVLPVKHFRTIDFVPVPAGGAGLWETIAGVALVVAGIVIAIASEGTLAWLSTPMITAGIGLVIGGVVQMFFGPKPPVQAHNSSDRGEKDAPSYLFSGPVNTIGQGGAVPLLYGRMIVGGQTVSSGIRTVSADAAGDTQTSDAAREEKVAVAKAIASTASAKVAVSNVDRLAKAAEQAVNE